MERNVANTSDLIEDNQKSTGIDVSSHIVPSTSRECEIENDNNYQTSISAELCTFCDSYLSVENTVTCRNCLYTIPTHKYQSNILKEIIDTNQAVRILEMGIIGRSSPSISVENGDKSEDNYIIPFELGSEDLTCNKSIQNHNNIIRVPYSTEVNPDFLDSLLKNNIKVFQQVSNTQSNKRILLLGSGLNRCPVCKKFFQNKEIFSNHITFKHKVERRGLLIKKRWDCVIKKNKKKTMIECEICHKKYLGALLRNHKKLIHNSDGYQCEACKKYFLFKASYKWHKCSVSASKKSRKQNLHRYRKCSKSTDHKIFNCDKCGESFATQQYLDTHSCIKTQENVKVPNELCPICGKLVKPLLYHIMVKHEGKEFKFFCHKCPKSFVHEGTFKNHYRRVHLAEKNFRCTECNKAFFNSAELRNHRSLKHLNVVRYTCAICGQGFAREDYFKRHMNAHAHSKSGNNNKKYKSGPSKCKFCSKTFSSVTNLRMHLYNHLNFKKKYTCTLCNFKFSAIKSMERHRQLHQDPLYKFRCVICWKRSTSKEELDKHLQIHEKSEKKHKCKECDKRFFSKYLLGNHVAEAHSTEEEYKKEKEIMFKEALKDFLL